LGLSRACYVPVISGPSPVCIMRCLLTQLANERRVLLFHRFDCIPEYFASRKVRPTKRNQAYTYRFSLIDIFFALP